MKQSKVHYTAHTPTLVFCGADVFLGTELEVSIEGSQTTMSIKLKLVLNSQIKKRQ